MKNILLINPNYELEIRWIVAEEELEVTADYMPLGLATVAALTPDDEYHVDIWDEFVRPQITAETEFRYNYDLVGLTSCRPNLHRAIELARIFRQRGIPVVIGGPGVSGTPDRCRNHFDVLFIGEAELTWPEFLRDWQEGRFRSEYRQIEKPDLSTSPLPRWDSVRSDLDKYAMGSVQTTRGCPFNCEFCDVVYLNGRRQRHKHIHQVLEEVRCLERLGVSTIFFSDDNFVGNHQYAKKLLRALIDLNNSFHKPLRYATQASIDVSRDDELLELLSDANFYQLVIGVETPNLESLRETGKFQNLKGDLIAEIHKVLSYGIVFRGALIVGFDHDSPDIFGQQYDFIQRARFPSISLHMLSAPIGTRLWRRLRAEGRVLEIYKITDKVTERIFTNIVPKRMSRIELMDGFKNLYIKVFSWDSFKERMLGFVDLAKRPPNVRQQVTQLQDLLDLGPALNLDKKGRQTLDEIATHTHTHAPYLMGRVKELIIQFVRYAESAHNLIPKLKRQIDLEASGKLSFELDTRPLTIPLEFRKAYRKIFPEIYRRVYLNLTDKRKVPEALVEVFVEFLVHEERFDGLEEFHFAVLNEICDRTCAELSQKPPEKFIPVTESEIPVPDYRQLRLHEDVIKSVEQEILRLVQTSAQDSASIDDAYAVS